MMVFDPFEASNYEEYIRELRKAATFWAEKAAKMPLEAGRLGLEDIPDFMRGQIGFLRSFIEEAYTANRLELSEVVRQLDETEKMLRQSIDRDMGRMRDFIDRVLGR